MNNNDQYAKEAVKNYMAYEAQEKVRILFRKQAASIKQHEVSNAENEDVQTEEVVSSKNGLWVIAQGKTAHLLWRCGIKSITRHEYPPFTCWSPCYCILTNDDKIVRIFDSQIGPRQGLKEVLSRESGVEVKKYKSDKKTNELLMEFLKQNSTVYSYPLHGGWLLQNQQWHFILQNQKTHFDDQASSVSFSDSTSYPVSGYTPDGVLLSSVHGYFHCLRNTLELIKDDWIRRILWYYIHAAAVCSFLKQHGIDFDTGLYIFSGSLKVRKFLEDLLDLYTEGAVALSDSRKKLADRIILSKDQFLLIRDEGGASENERYFKDVLRTGEVRNLRWKDPTTYKLQAVPVIISDGRSNLKECDKLNHLTIDEEDLVSGASEKLGELKLGINLYIGSFIATVAGDGNFIPTIRKHIGLAFENTPKNLDLRREAVNTIGILNGIRESLESYYRRYCISEAQVFYEYTQFIVPHDYGKLYQRAESAVGADVDPATLFFENARIMLKQEEIRILRREQDNRFYYRESDLGNPQILMDPDYTYIPTRAFLQICNACQIKSSDMKKALAENGLLFDSVKQSGTYQARLTVHPSITDDMQLYMYKVETWRLQEEEFAKSAGEVDYSLQLGKDINGRIRTWNGGVNSHIRITGMSGTGKSYLLRYLAGQLPGQGVKCIIFDSTGDFSHQRGRQPQGWPVEGTKVLNMKEEPFELIPFTPQDEKENAADIASRISSTISVALGFGKRQTGHLTQRIADGLQSGALKEFRDLKDLLRPDEKSSQSAKSVYSAMDGLWDAFPANAKPFDWEFDKSGITIINLHEAYSEAAEKIVVEMLLGELYSKRMRNSMTDMPHLVLVMDECQRLCWNENSFASKLMKESRKFGISVWAGTQTVGKKTLSQALGQCGLQIAFMPDGNSAASLAKELTGFNKVLINKCTMRLMGLERGQFLYVKNGEIVVASAP